jgi:hypothetical protein
VAFESVVGLDSIEEASGLGRGCAHFKHGSPIVLP